MAGISKAAKGVAASAATKVVSAAAKTVVDAVADKTADLIQGDTSAASAPALAGGPTAPVEPAPAHAVASPIVEAAAAIAADAVVDALGLDAAPSLRVTALQPERRRAGFKFTSIGETISAALVKLEQLHALVSDPMLRVEVSVDGVEFKMLSRDDLPPLPGAPD